MQQNNGSGLVCYSGSFSTPDEDEGTSKIVSVNDLFLNITVYGMKI